MKSRGLSSPIRTKIDRLRIYFSFVSYKPLVMGAVVIRSISDRNISCIVMLSFFCCICTIHSYVKFFGGALFVGTNAARALCAHMLYMWQSMIAVIASCMHANRAM